MKGIVLRNLKKIVLTMGLGLALYALLPTGTASAFSAYGAGTSINPYRISTCDQLQEMQDDLDGYYKLVSNIDCTGVAYTSVSTFSGTLEGDHHTISNLTSTPSGLFQFATGATIRNLTISSGTASGNGSQGSFIGYSENSQLSNVHSSMTIAIADAPSAAYLGGLVGGSAGGTTIDGSSYSGTINGGGYTGGLVGYMGNISTPTADVLSNSYFDGTINEAGVFVGGAVGILYSGTVRNTYSSGVMHIVGTSNYLGGLIGLSYRGATNNSFSATLIDGDGATTGGMFASFYVTTNSWNSTRSNVYHDQYRSNGNNAYSRTCVSFDEGSGNCTAVNASNATPSYFKNNSTNAPLNHVSWDFTNTWRINSGYPALRNMSGFVDPVVPNNGDANGDNTADSYQARVASVQNSSNVWSTIELPNSSGCTVANPTAVDAQSLKSDAGLVQQLSTMTSFDAYCPTAGSTTQVTVIYDNEYSTSKSVLRHYNPTTNTYTTVPGAVFSTRVIGGVTKTIVTYSITDGGALDTDGLANGIIKDPVGFAIVPTAPSTGLGKPYQPIAISILALLSAASFVAGLIVVRSKHQ